MKITPLAQSIGAQAGTAVGTTGNQSTSSERLAAAKAVASGDRTFTTTVKEEPVDKQVERIQNIRRIKMQTNASPDRYVPDLVDASLEDKSIETDNNTITPAVIEETKPLSPQFAQLAKMRRAIQVKEKEIEAREKALQSSGTSGASQDVMGRLKASPLSVLQEAGVSYDDLTKAIMENPVNPEIQSLKEEIKALKEGIDKNFLDRDQQTETQVLAEIGREANNLVSQGDDYEMIRETKSVPDVIELIKRTHKKTGEILDVKEACNLIEEELINESLKIARINKIQSRLTPQQAAQLKSQQPQMRTLTNRDTAPPVLDRKTRAIMAMQGTLKK